MLLTDIDLVWYWERISNAAGLAGTEFSVTRKSSLYVQKAKTKKDFTNNGMILYIQNMFIYVFIDIVFHLKVWNSYELGLQTKKIYNIIYIDR